MEAVLYNGFCTANRAPAILEVVLSDIDRFVTVYFLTVTDGDPINRITAEGGIVILADELTKGVTQQVGHLTEEELDPRFRNACTVCLAVHFVDPVVTIFNGTDLILIGDNARLETMAVSDGSADVCACNTGVVITVQIGVVAVFDCAAVAVGNTA